MSVDTWWLGAATSTSASVVCRSDATGTVTIGVGSSSFAGAADTAIDDGVVAINCTGLQPGTAYDYTIDGVPSGTLRTQAANPDDVWIGSGSCWAPRRVDTLSHIARDYDLSLMLALGDFPYANDGVTNLWGETAPAVTASLANSKDYGLYCAHHRQMRKAPGIAELMRSTPFLYMPDDHEYPYDNARPGNLAAYQTGVTGAGSATQEDFDAAWAASRTAAEAYCTGFVFGFDSDVTPADADAVYGSYKIGELVEVFLIDCINYSSNTQAADDASKTMLGAAQKARLIDAMTHSTATWKLIASGKQFFKGGANTDTFNAHFDNPGYETEKAEILYALRNVTGMLAVGGDQHLWSDQWVNAGELGTDMPAISMLIGCPTSVAVNAAGVAGYATGVRSKFNGYPATTECLQDNVIALFRFTATRAYRYLLSTRTGMIACGHINAGSNQVQYQRARIG